MDRSSLVLYSITAVPVYFPFTIHRNPIILVNAFNSPATHRHPSSVTIDALLIIGMTKAISDRLSDAKRGREEEEEGRRGLENAVRFPYLSVQSCNLPNGTNFPNVTHGTQSPNKSYATLPSSTVEFFPKLTDRISSTIFTKFQEFSTEERSHIFYLFFYPLLFFLRKKSIEIDRSLDLLSEQLY